MSQSPGFYLFDSESKAQVGPLSSQELLSAIAKLSAAQRRMHFAWQPAWQNWRPLEECIATNAFIESKGAAPQENVDALDTDAFIDRDLVKKVKHAYDDKRKYPRFDFQIACTITNGRLTINSKTKDISLGGVALIEPIPVEMLKTRCLITLEGVAGDPPLTFAIQLSSRGEPRYFYFSEFEPGDLQKLEQWFTKLSQVAIKRPAFKL